MDFDLRACDRLSDGLMVINKALCLKKAFRGLSKAFKDRLGLLMTLVRALRALRDLIMRHLPSKLPGLIWPEQASHILQGFI